MRLLPLLVGMAPARPDREGETPFVGTASGRRLARYAGLTSDQCLPEHFDMVNLIPTCLTNGWPKELAAERAMELNATLAREGRLGGRRVVLLSKCVAEAFGRRYEHFFEWDRAEPTSRAPSVAVSPHPSGLVRFWNDPMSRVAGERFFQALARGEDDERWIRVLQ